MKNILYPTFFLFIILTSCSPKMLPEIQSIQPEPFEPIELTPSLEMHDMRIDIIRNTETVKVNDSTTKTEDVDYHPLGFDLGNGIFFDLNENLSFRVDYLLGYDQAKDFNVTRIIHPYKKKYAKDFSYKNDSMKHRYHSIHPEKMRYYFEPNADSLVRYYCNMFSQFKFSYAFVQHNDELLFRGKRRVFDRIIQDEENSYHINKFIRSERYTLEGDTVNLAWDYVLVQSDDGRKIQVLSHRRNGNHYPLYTIERDNEKILIYTHKGYGSKIEYGDDRITLYRNDHEVLRWEFIQYI